MTTVRIPRGMPRIQYQADGTQTTFTYSFPIFEAEDLVVYLNAAPQSTGYTVTGMGNTGGGTVTFATAPADGALILLTRRLPIERITDFRESGPLTAAALNREFDTLTACLQQVAADQESMLRYYDNDLPASSRLPRRDLRAGKLFCFDGSGNPAVRPPVDEDALATFYQQGDGSVGRRIQDKLADWVSVKDFGAVGDGIVDDTLAIQAAMAAANAVVLPAGTYHIANTLTLRDGCSLSGNGQSSVLKAASRSFDAIHIPAGYTRLSGLRIEGAEVGVRLFGRDGPCVQNALFDLSIWDADVGLVFDGYTRPDWPCYWNNVARVLIARPATHGVWLTKTGDGDSPNANHFHNVRVFSMSAPMTGSGFYIQNGKYNNAFVDCEANVWPKATACFRVGPDTNKNLFVNVYGEALGGVPNIQLDAGSTETSIFNLFSAAAGPAIYDKSGGAYTAFNAGYPEKNRLGLTRVGELVVETMRYDTQYVEPAAGGTIDLALGSSVYLISAYGGAVTARLPQASQCNGFHLTVKKTDASVNAVSIVETNGLGADQRTVVLGNRFDFVNLVSNGAAWWIVGGNFLPGNASFHEGAGVFQPDLSQTLYLVSAYSGAVEVRLPRASASHAVGRTVSIKKADQSANPVTVTQDDGGGPDNEAIALSGFGHAITVMSNGAGWFILGRNP